jgi:glutamate carboxypeptidase
MALGVARALSVEPERFAELSVLLVNDEEWRVRPFAHFERFAGYYACLCFEAGQLGPEGDEAVIVRRKAAGTLRVIASGRAAHSGSAPDQGRNALLALAHAAQRVAGCHAPGGDQHLSVVPTIMRSGQAFNVVPADGELVVDMRADTAQAFAVVPEAVPEEIDGVGLEARMERVWPGMDSGPATTPVLRAASARIERTIVGGARGGASDASHFAAMIPLTIDGLGPRGGGAHTPGEYVLAASLRDRAEVALAIAAQALE